MGKKEKKPLGFDKPLTGDKEIVFAPSPIKPEPISPITVFDVLNGIVGGWPYLVVRVRQNGRMEFVRLSQVTDQRLVYNIVKALLRQGLKENGVL